MREMLDDPRFARRAPEVAHFRVDESCIREFLYSTQAEPTEAQICFCGHPKRSHASKCRVSGYSCGCKEFSLAVYAMDPRPFYRETAGPGLQHGLNKGLANARDLNIPTEFAVTTRCSRGPFHGPAILVGLSERHSPSFTSPVRSSWLCRECSKLNPKYYQEIEWT